MECILGSIKEIYSRKNAFPQELIISFILFDAFVPVSLLITASILQMITRLEISWDTALSLLVDITKGE